MPQSTKKNLFETMTENLHEVRLDQIREGDWVAVAYHGRRLVAEVMASSTMLDLWEHDHIDRRFFMAEPPAPAPEYEPGTLARVTDCLAPTNAIRGKAAHGLVWVDQHGAAWNDDEVSHVEVIAYPDGTRPIPEITEEDVYEALIVAGEYDTEARKGEVDGAVGQGFRVALEDFAARKFGGQA